MFVHLFMGGIQNESSAELLILRIKGNEKLI